MNKKMMSVLVLLLLAAVSPAQIVMPNAIGSGGGGGSIGSGSTVTSCTSSILTASAASLLACDPASIVNGSVSTAGRSILTIRDTITGASATSNFLSVVGTTNATTSAQTTGVLFDIDTGAGTGSSGPVNALKVVLQPGLTEQVTSYAGNFDNQTAHVGTAVAVGVAGISTGTASLRYGGHFGFTEPQNAGTSSYALGADNGTVAANIFVAKDNSTPVFTIADGGATTTTGVWNWTTNSSYFSTNVGLFFGASPNDGVAGIVHKANQTPDTASFVTPGTSNSWQLTEFNDLNSFDFNNGACGTAACTDPGLIIHSAAQDTTQYNHLANWGQAGGALKTLTESAATSVIQIPIANLAGAFGEFCYTVKAADATDSQIRGSCIKYTVTAKAGTETCTLNTQSATTSDASIIETEDGSGSGAITTGTLTYAITCSTTPSNAVDIQINAVSSLTQTTLNVTYKVNHVGPGQPARQ